MRSEDPEVSATNEPKPRVSLSSIVAAPMSNWTPEDWQNLSNYIRHRCWKLIGKYGGGDPEAVSQEVLLVILQPGFASRIDHRLGNLATFVEGIIQRSCRSAVSLNLIKRRSLASITNEEVPATSNDPVQEAQNAEIRECLEHAAEFLTPAELSALPSVIDRAQDSRNQGRARPFAEYAQRTRCRRRLREILKKFL